MRVSDSAVYGALNKHLANTKAELAVAQERAGTGVKVAKPSDDPVAFAAARREHAKKTLAEAGMKAADLAQTHLNGADEALGIATDAIATAKELALQGASDTLGPEQRAGLAENVRQLRAQLVTLGNTEVAGSYIFAGYKDAAPPYSSAGTFSGDSTTKEVSAYPGMRTSASVSGEDAFGTNGSTDNMFDVLDRLATALETNDTAGVRAELTGLDTGEKRILATRSRVGSIMDGVETARSVADRYAYSAGLEAGRLTEVDEVSAVTDLLKAKSAMDAALAVAQQLPTGGLVRQRS
jgi:flagellar hook-associated protein 3 FlgL